MRRATAAFGALALLGLLGPPPATAMVGHHHSAAGPAHQVAAVLAPLAPSLEAPSEPGSPDDCCPDHRCCLSGFDSAPGLPRFLLATRLEALPYTARPMDPLRSRPRYLLPVWLAPPTPPSSR